MLGLYVVVMNLGMFSSGSRIIIRSAALTAWHFTSDLQAGGLGLGPRARHAARRSVDAGLVAGSGRGVALGAVADDGDLLAFDEGEVGVLCRNKPSCFPFSFSCAEGPGMPGWSLPAQLKKWVLRIRMRSPRPMPVTPERTVSRIRARSMAPTKESSFLLVAGHSR